MPGRKYEAGNGYRYGFNGKENDNEVKGEGNQQDYGMRIYDPRIGRFLSLDPLQKNYPHLTPYQFAGNIPSSAIDLDGLETVMHYYVTNIKNHGSINVLVNTTSNGKPGYTAEFKYQGTQFTSGVYATKQDVQNLVNYTSRSLSNAWDYTPNGKDSWYKGVNTLEGIVNEDNKNEQEIQNGEQAFQSMVLAGMALYSAATESAPINRSSMVGTTTSTVGGQVTRAMAGNTAAEVENTEASKSVSLPSTSPKYNPNKAALSKSNMSVPASANGHSPDFENTPYLYPVSGNQKNIVRIKLTGSYTKDFENANAAAGLSGSKPPKNYVWHHLDDFDTKTGEATLQLTRLDAHTATVPHTGSVKQYEIHNNTTYKK